MDQIIGIESVNIRQNLSICTIGGQSIKMDHVPSLRSNIRSLYFEPTKITACDVKKKRIAVKNEYLTTSNYKKNINYPQMK